MDGVLDVPREYLKEGENLFTFIFADDLDSSTSGFRLSKLEIAE